MKTIQGKYVIGYVTIKIRGKQPEQFFQYCIQHHITVWNVKKVSKDLCVGNVYAFDVKKIEHLIEGLPYQLRIQQGKGVIPLLQRVLTKRIAIFSICLSILLLFVLSNIVWKLEITGVSKEMDEKIRQQLMGQGLYEGAWSFHLDSLDEMQRTILHNLPGLMYIGIDKKGTTYHVDAIEKLEEKKPPASPVQHLIAKKDGVIKKVFVKNGISQVAVHDIVKKGDLLVSGIITLDDEQKNEDDSSTQVKVSAEGKIYATTWYEMDLTSSLLPTYEKLTGEKQVQFGLQIGGAVIPIWGFRSPSFPERYEEIDKQPVKLFHVELPMAVVKKTIYDKKTIQRKRTRAEAKQIAISQMRAELRRKLGNDAEILKYKVLHERVENGKVKMNLYVSVLENIAISKTVE